MWLTAVSGRRQRQLMTTLQAAALVGVLAAWSQGVEASEPEPGGESCVAGLPVPALPTSDGRLTARYVDFDRARAEGELTADLELEPPSEYPVDSVGRRRYSEVRDLFGRLPDNYNYIFDFDQPGSRTYFGSSFYGIDGVACVWYMPESYETVRTHSGFEFEQLDVEMLHNVELRDGYALVDTRPTRSWREAHPLPDFVLVEPVPPLTTVLDAAGAAGVIGGRVVFDDATATVAGVAWDGDVRQVVVATHVGSGDDDITVDMVTEAVESMLGVAETEPASTSMSTLMEVASQVDGDTLVVTLTGSGVDALDPSELIDTLTGVTLSRPSTTDPPPTTSD